MLGLERNEFGGVNWVEFGERWIGLNMEMNGLTWIRFDCVGEKMDCNELSLEKGVLDWVEYIALA